MERRQSERSFPHLSDEELEFYGNLYVECQIREAGVDFESFLNNPEYYLRKYAQGRWRAVFGKPEGRKGLLRFLRLRPATRTPSE
ncbi:MAG: hypothetical protein ABSD47_17195 [Candidatus Methylomirabilota bacterium]|jgi:hypothetical protein